MYITCSFASLDGRASRPSKHCVCLQRGRRPGEWCCSRTLCVQAIAYKPQDQTSRGRRRANALSRLTAADVATKHLQTSRPGPGVLVVPPTRDPQLPQLFEGNALVLVEGLNDAAVTRRAVNAPVLVAGGTNSAKGAAGFRRIQQAVEAVQKVVILADPDAEGSRFRNWVSMKLKDADCLHAFLPVSRAVLYQDTEFHTLGNVGVEYAHERDVAKALSLARPRTAGEGSFSHLDLEDWELLNQWDDVTTQNAALRRELVCNSLGLGKMDGGKLVKALNAYGFSRKQVRWTALHSFSLLATRHACSPQQPHRTHLCCDNVRGTCDISLIMSVAGF
jgi:5S rRNA maturation endonuclease (ribonuclease M5)